MEQKYLGYVIKYSEDADEWVAFEGETRIAASVKLSEVKKKLDRLERDEKKGGFKRVQAFWDKWNSGFVECTVTSIADDEAYVWLSSKYGRSKENARSVFVATEANLAIREQIEAKRKEMGILKEELSSLNAKLECFKPRSPSEG